MIQRVQSIWLFLATVTLFCLLFLPLLKKTINGKEYILYTTGVNHELQEKDGTSYKVTAVGGIAVNLAAFLLCAVCIFQFRNRNRQKQLAISAILLIVIMTGLYAFNGQLLPGGITGASVRAGAFLPLLSIVFCLLAIRGIRKDEQLLKSADRLR